MASPQTRNLKTANGGKVAPQHYNDAMGDFEYSKGSDGALHTKVINQPNVTLVDKNGNPIDSGNKLPVDVAFPTEQAVKDADVLAKLAEIETKIQATNDRLNQTLNTQLTGSIVEQGRVNNFLVTAGSRTLFVNLNVKDYTRYTVESRSTIAHTYSIDVDFSVQSGAVSAYRATKTFSSNAAGIILSTPDYLQTPNLNCYIINKDTVDHYYDAGVILFK